MKYKPTQGTTSKARAKKHLDKFFIDYNTVDIKCPLTGELCNGFKCAAWEKATVYLSNRGRMRSEDSIYDVRPGLCRSPVITGVIKVLK